MLFLLLQLSCAGDGRSLTPLSRPTLPYFLHYLTTALLQGIILTNRTRMSKSSVNVLYYETFRSLPSSISGG